MLEPFWDVLTFEISPIDRFSLLFEATVYWFYFYYSKITERLDIFKPEMMLKF